MNNHPSRRSYAITLFLILLTCYGYFLPKWDDIDWVANSRADLVYAIGDRAVLYIDDYHENTGDKAFFNGHYYSVGSIGPSLVALPFYMIFKGIAVLPPLKDFFLSDQVVIHFQNRLTPESAPISLNFKYQNLALAFITFFSISVPSAILGTILFLFLARFTRKDSYAFTLALVYGLGTVVFPYSKALFQHQIAAFGAFAGFFLLWRVIYEGANLRWLWVVGLLFGLTAISEYPVIPFLGLIFLWAVYKGSIRHQLYRVILGALPMLLIFIMYNLATFSTLLPISYKYHVFHHELHGQGLMGITTPSLDALYGVTISPFRGLFFISPVLILAIPGLYFMWRQKYRDVAILLAFIIAGFFLYNISYLFWSGGYAVGPRYLIPMIPFMMMPISLAFNRWLNCLTGYLIIGLLIILSIVNVWAQTIAGQYYPPILSDGLPLNNPLIDYSLPLILAGDIAHNYGNFLGLAGLPSLVPLLIIVAGIYLVPHLYGQPSQYRSNDLSGRNNQRTSKRLTLANRFRSQYLALALWSFWAVALLMVYYKQLWRLFVVGPSAWLLDNYSLALVWEFWKGLTVWSLPALSEALIRAGGAVSGAGIVLLAAHVLGLGICRMLGWRPVNLVEAILYRTALGLGAISYLSLGLAVLGFYYASSVQILITVVLVGGALWAVYSGDRFSLGWQEIKALFRLFFKEHTPFQDRVWQMIVVLAILMAFICALAPEIEGDALWYHLWLPQLWLQHGQPVDIIAEYISLYPLTWELVFGAGLVWGGPIAAKLLHFACLPLTGLLVYQLSRRFLPRVSPWLATALFVTIPTVLWEATTAYVDLALAFYTGLVIYALLQYMEGRQWQWLGLAALNLGMALATKHLALFVLVLMVSGLALRLWLEERNLRRALAPAILLAGLSLLLPLPWYIRAWFASGNPFFPDLYQIFGAFPAERWNDISEYGLTNFKNHFGDPRTPLNLLILPWNMTIHAARYGGSLGPMFLLLFPALILRRYTRIVLWLLAFVVLYVALWASPISSFQLRFLMPITPLLAVLAAEAAGRLAELLSGLKRYSVIAYGGMVGLLLLNLPPFTSLHEPDRVIWDGWLIHVVAEVPFSVVIGRESQENYLSRKVPSYAAWRYINTHLSPQARLLTFSGGDNFYSERDRIPAFTTLTADVLGAKQGQEQQAVQAMGKLDITHVLLDKRLLEAEWMNSLAIIQPTMINDWYQLIYDDNRFMLFGLRREDLTLPLAETSSFNIVSVYPAMRNIIAVLLLVIALAIYGTSRIIRLYSPQMTIQEIVTEGPTLATIKPVAPGHLNSRLPRTGIVLLATISLVFAMIAIWKLRFHPRFR